MMTSESTDQPGSPVNRARRRLRLSALSALVLLFWLAFNARFCGDQITHSLFVRQDFWLLGAFALITIVALANCKAIRVRPRFGVVHLYILAVIVVIICFLGHYTVLAGYDLTRDEHLANFDAWIFVHGRSVWPLPEEWQTESGALNLLYMIPVAQPVAWISAYLPMNAALRGLVGTLGTSALTGPLVTGLSLPLLWGCARRLWPDDREAGVVAILMLGSSGQFLFTGMTAFAMPAHLFFNLLWLWLFLGNSRTTDALALVAGFVATGLHQPLFHPLFAAPWLLLLLHRRRFERFVIFVAAYALICGFWLWWPHHVQTLVTGSASTPLGNMVDYWSRLVTTFSQNRSNASYMASNLLRFCTWQNVLMVPLIIVGFKSARSNDQGNALLAGLLLPIIVMAVILPAQGFGFGYRYLHPVLGNAALLAAVGWRRLGERCEELRVPLLLATALSMMLLWPMQALMTHRLMAMVAQKDEELRSSGADYVFLPSISPVVVDDFAYNLPDLSNRPLLLLSGRVRHIDALAARLCHRGEKVALASDGMFVDLKRYFDTDRQDDRAWLSRMTSTLAVAGCSVKILRQGP